MSNDDQELEPRIDRIPIRGGIGVGIVIVVLVAGMLLDLPGLRIPALVGIAGGVILAAVLVAWHRGKAGKISEAISIASKPPFTQPCRNPEGCDGTARLKVQVPLQQAGMVRPDGSQFTYECPTCGFVEWRGN
jgi:hypothetical protein